MKKLLCLILTIIITALSLAACGKPSVTLYDSDVSGYVDLGKYKGLELNKNSSEIKKIYNDLIEKDIDTYYLYERKYEGSVAYEDIINVDYEAKIDGKTNSKWSRNNLTLKIAEDTFIDGFETGLIGAHVGDTVILNLTFPKPYTIDESVAGKAVVFTVKINFINTDVRLTPKDSYKYLDYDSQEDYEEDLLERAIEDYLFAEVSRNSKIKEYPQEYLDREYELYKKRFPSVVGVDFETYIETTNENELALQAELVEYVVKPIIKKQFIVYAILKKEKLQISQGDIAEAQEDLLEKYNDPSVTVETITNEYGEDYFEYLAVVEEVMDLIADKAKITK